VIKLVSGYSGGTIPHPTYQQVCSGATGHAEVVQVTFDPLQITYKELLEVFFTIHDPTTRNRQGNDVGTQYRSAIFYHDDEQEAIAGEVIKEVVPFTAFYPAEAYHQDYFKRNPAQPYCQVVIAPKVAKFRQKFAARLSG
jgi:peptide-methionine (S)-S-oxide reductase